MNSGGQHFTHILSSSSMHPTFGIALCIPVTKPKDLKYLTTNFTKFRFRTAHCTGQCCPAVSSAPASSEIDYSPVLWEILRSLTETSFVFPCTTASPLQHGAKFADNGDYISHIEGFSSPDLSATFSWNHHFLASVMFFRMFWTLCSYHCVYMN